MVFVLPIFFCLVVLLFFNEQWFLDQTEESFIIKVSFLALLLLSFVYDLCNTWLVIGMHPILSDKTEPGKSHKKLFSPLAKFTHYPKTVESLQELESDYV